MYTLGKPTPLITQLLVVATVFLTACTKNPENINFYNLLEGVYKASFAPISYGLPLYTPTKTVRIYIEGDGRAWISKYHPSYNPTPHHSLILKLMQLDPTPAVYLARPCQYYLNENCQQYDWTEGRHAEKMVVVMNDAISFIKEKYQAQYIELIGHSGGGTMATLIAARRLDVKRIITIAADLDISFFTQYHHVTPMKGSLNPMDITDKIKNIPQLHLTGGKDKIIPPQLVKRFIEKSASPCLSYKEYPQNTHHKGWLAVWPEILAEKFTCRK